MVGRKEDGAVGVGVGGGAANGVGVEHEEKIAQ